MVRRAQKLEEQPRAPPFITQLAIRRAIARAPE